MEKCQKGTKEELFSIGDVSRTTDISVYTLRMWERRYGAPFSIKLRSGHRRYSSDEIGRIRLVKLALGLGQKPSRVVNLSVDELQSIIDLQGATTHEDSGSSIVIEKIIDAIKKWDERALSEILMTEWQARGPVGFVTQIVPSLLHRIGEGWAYGELDVASEHFTSEILEAFLVGRWREANDKAQRSSVVLATLDGEQHGFGLHMIAVILTTLGHRVIFLGVSTPDAEIVNAVNQNNSAALCVSISEFYDSYQAHEKLNSLRRTLPKKVKITCGGRGIPGNIAGIKPFHGIRVFYDWLRSGALT